MSGGPASQAGAFPTFESIGVRTLINCRGTYTAMSGSRTLPEVKAAMEAAGGAYVDINELQEACGVRLGELMQCELGMVTNGCAAALAHMAAACIAGKDREKQARLPFTDGMPNEVVVQNCHRFGYDYAMKAMGAKFVEVQTLSEMQAAISDKTVMLLFLGDAVDNHPGQTQVSVSQMAALSKANGRAIPLFVDAAAEPPHVPNEYLSQGADAVAYSGGKGLRGPQSSGLLLGSRQLIEAARANASPNGGIGRPMKVGKEEWMGLLAAVEQWVARDHAAEWTEWERRLEVLRSAAVEAADVSGLSSLRTDFKSNRDRKANIAPELSISWTGGGLSPQDVAAQLDSGTPRIQCFSDATGLKFMPHMMEDQEEIVVAHRLAELITAAGAAGAAAEVVEVAERGRL